jgi:hypothetical protein
MVQPSLLEVRVMAILNNDASRTTRRVITIPLGVALLTLTLAAAQPVISISSPHPASSGPSSDATPALSLSNPTAHMAESPVGAPQADRSRDSACSPDLSSDQSFTGSTSTTEAGGRTVIQEQVGTRGYDRIIQKSLGDVRVCMLAQDVGDRDTAGRPSDWIGRASHVVLEVHRGALVQRMEFGRPAGGGVPISWAVNRAQRPVDDEAQQWRGRTLALLDAVWERSMLRGEVSSLHGEISSIQGERSSLQGEISSLQGEVSSMQGRVSAVRGQESSLRGQISSIQGHVSALQGAISAEQGAISSLGARYDLAPTDRTRVARHDAEIARIEREIRAYDAGARVAAVEREIAALNAEHEVGGIESDIRAFNLEGKVSEIQKRIEQLDVEGKLAAIERRITALDADRRLRLLEQRQADELKQLEAAIARIR